MFLRIFKFGIVNKIKYETMWKRNWTTWSICEYFCDNPEKYCVTHSELDAVSGMWQADGTIRSSLMIPNWAEVISSWLIVCLFYSDSPTKLDRAVLSAIEGTDIDPQKYPSIHKWKSTVKSYSASDMQRLVSLAGILMQGFHQCFTGCVCVWWQL